MSGGARDAQQHSVTSVQLLGTTRLDGAPAGLAGRLELLLAVLVVRGERGIRRDELVDLLWPYEPPRAPGAALNPLLSRLRRRVGPVEGRGVVRLRLTADVDVLAALAALDGAGALAERDPAQAHALAAGAAEVLAAELLPAHDDPWTREQRARLVQRRGEALALAAACGLRAGAATLPAAVAAAEALVALAPLHERGVALLMEGYVARGDETAALQAYEALRVRLRDELATVPGRRLREQHAALVRGAGGGEPAAGAVALPPLLERERRRPLAGRRAELAQLADAAAPRGEPGLVVIEGAPGIGKTRLLAELAARRQGAGATILVGRCLAVPTAPFAPLVEALRPALLATDPDRLVAALGPLAGELARVVPALQRRLPTQWPAAGDPDTSRFRLFEAVVAAIALLDDGAGVLLALDDAQWLDRSSAQLAGHVLRAAELPGLVVAVTVRSGSPEPPAAVGDLHAAARASVTTVVALGPLDAAAVGELVAAEQPDADPELAGRLARSTGGSPLLVRASLVTGSAVADTPALVRAVAGALTWSGPGVRAFVEVAAVDGGRAGLDVLAVACDTTVDDAAARADRAQAAGLLAPRSGPASFGALHDTVRDAVLASLGPAQRSALHARLAVAYEAVHAADLDAVAAELAGHWGAADGRATSARAAHYAERAARRALGSLAYEQAATLARDAREQHDGAGGDDAHRVALLLLEGDARHRAGAPVEARAVLGDALARARGLGRRDLIARAAIEHGGHRMGAGLRDHALVPVLEEGLSAAGAGGDDVLRARLAGRLAAALLEGPAPRRDALSLEAVALARASGDARALAETLLWRHVGLLHRGRPAERAPLVDEAEALARAHGLTELALHARLLRFGDLLEGRRLAEARAEMDAWSAEAAAAHAPYHHWAAAIRRPTLALLDGRLDDVRDEVERARLLARPLGADVVVLAAQVAQWLSLQVASGEIEAARGGLEAVIASQGTLPAWDAGVAFCQAISGDREGARDRVVRACAADPDRIVDPNRLTGLSYLATAGVVSAAPPDALARLRDALAPNAGGWILQHLGGTVHGPVDARLALLEAALGRPAQARAHLDAAIDGLGPEPPAGLCADRDVALARVLVAEGDPAEATRVAQAAAARAEATGLLGPARLLGEIVR